MLKLPTPEGEDLSEGILEAIDMDSYRAEKQAEARIVLPDADGEIDPIPPGGSGGATDPEMTALSQLVAEFNDLFGNIDWSDEDRVLEIIATRLLNVNADVAYQNAKKNSIARMHESSMIERYRMQSPNFLVTAQNYSSSSLRTTSSNGGLGTRFLRKLSTSLVSHIDPTDRFFF